MIGDENSVRDKCGTEQQGKSEAVGRFRDPTKCPDKPSLQGSFLFFDTESRVSLCCPGCPHTHGLPTSVSLLSGNITDMPHPYQKSLKIFQLTQTQVSYSLH